VRRAARSRTGGLLAVAALFVAMVSAPGSGTHPFDRLRRGVEHDVVIRGGTVYDGSGAAPVSADVAIDGDRIAAVGDLSADRGRLEVDARGMAVTPGFVNMLSHSFESLLQDGRGQSDVRQGVTLEVFGEISMGPWNDGMRRDWEMQVRHPVPWSTLGEYFEHVERSGIAPNVASFVSAGVVRNHVIGLADREAAPEELEQMQALVRQSMEEGAVGLTCAMIYPPCSYVRTGELVELARAVAERDGLVALHLRSEGVRLLEGVDEILHVARAAGARAEI
jgi:N-acyl-D-amino-acid deacylase